MSAAAPVKPSRIHLWRDIWGLLREFWAAHPLALLISVLVLLIGNSRIGLYVISMGGLIDALAGTDPQGRSPLFWASVYAGASATEQLYWAAKSLSFHFLRDHGTFRVQQKVLSRAAQTALIQFERGSFFQHLQRASDKLPENFNALTNQLLDVGQLLVAVISTSLALALVHPVLLPLMILGTLPSVWLQTRVATLVYNVQHRHATGARARDQLKKLLTGRDGAAEVRLFRVGDFLLRRWSKLRSDFGADMVGAERRRALATVTGSLVGGVAYAGGLVLVAALIVRGELSVGDWVTVAAGALWFQELLGGLLSVIPALEERSRFLGDLFAFLRIARPQTAAGHTGTPAAPPVARAGARGMQVETERLTFAYPGSERPVLRDISLDIRRGERIAIVGENGAGKTTLVKLLVGLYSAATGVVRVDGQVLTESSAAAMRPRIAAVFQDFATFQLTVRDNIGFGNLALMHDDGALTAAAQRAGTAEVIEQLPGGLETYLGRDFGDTDLSGGQWQRLALARAFLRDGDLLVLDEPTAALDPLAELALFERFMELVEGRTAIMISHRLGAARLADRILVLSDGSIVESGTHEELMALNGEYARMFSAQAQWYR